MTLLFHTILFRPLFNLLVAIYNLTPGGDFGLAIIFLTIVVRIVFFPLSIKALVSQKELGRLQPKIKEIQDKFKDDKQAIGKATMDLYKEHKINPFGGCLPILIQLPVLIALYSALRLGLKPDSLKDLYSFVHNPGLIKQIAFGFVDLTKKSPYLAILAGILQFLQTKQSTSLQAPISKTDPGSSAAQMNQQMLYFFPVMVIIIAWNLPTGLTLYWVTATLFSIFEQFYIKNKYK